MYAARHRMWSFSAGLARVFERDFRAAAASAALPIPAEADRAVVMRRIA
jgi:hypothetical protein